ncbi:MAG: hypothetical protein WA628_01610, partial [Terriglobales bacterium]
PPMASTRLPWMCWKRWESARARQHKPSPVASLQSSAINGQASAPAAWTGEPTVSPHLSPL